MNENGKLLIVDDEPNMLLVLEDAVSGLGFETKTAPTYATALEAMRTFEPDLVLCDLRLDAGNGLELFDISRGLPKPAQFVFLSGHGTIEAAVQALKGGAFDFLIKPVGDQKLNEVLKAAMQRKKEQPNGQKSSSNNGISLRDELEGHERQLIVDALERNGWIQAKAARELGLERSHLHYKIRKYGLTKPQAAAK